MRINRQSSLADATLQELFYRNRNGSGHARQKTVLALLFHHMNGMDEGLNGLRELRQLCGQNVRIQICPDDSILDHYDVSGLASQAGIDDWISLDKAEKQREKVDVFFLPVLPFSAVSDVLGFNDARQSIRLLLWALMSGKKVSAFAAGADPYHSIWKQAGLDHGPAFMKHEMRSQLQKLKGFGVQLLNHHSELQKLFRLAIQREQKRLVTAETIREKAEAGLRIVDVEQGAIITPLARDLAKEYQIEINEKRAGEFYGNGDRGWKSNSNQKRR